MSISTLDRRRKESPALPLDAACASGEASSDEKAPGDLLGYGEGDGYGEGEGVSVYSPSRGTGRGLWELRFASRSSAWEPVGAQLGVAKRAVNH